MKRRLLILLLLVAVVSVTVPFWESVWVWVAYEKATHSHKADE